MPPHSDWPRDVCLFDLPPCRHRSLMDTKRVLITLVAVLITGIPAFGLGRLIQSRARASMQATQDASWAEPATG